MAPKLEKKRNLSWIMHILIFLMVYCLPFAMNPRHSSFNFVDYVGFFVPMTAYVILFYLNFYLFINKFLFKKKIWMYVLVNLGVILVFGFLLRIWGNFYFETYIAPNLTEGSKGPGMRFGMFFKDFMFMFMTICIATAFKTTMEWYKMDREKARIEAVASQAELKNLKSQLNPHFLFNSLNNIYSLMRVDTDKAQDSILGLSKILRYVMNENNQEKVMLSEEISFMKSYISLMSLRMAKNMKLTTDIHDFHDSTATIAPLLFISLVENAFKHGISPSEPSFIDIRITPTEDGKGITCIVRNSYFPKLQNDYSGSWIGIENLKKRLNLLYPDKYIFTGKVENGTEYYSKLLIALD